MKFLTKLFAITAIIGLSHHAAADPVPSELLNFYKGKGTIISPDPEASGDKVVAGITLTNETEAIFSIFNDEGVPGEEVSGETMYIPEIGLLLLKFEPVPGLTFTGGLVVKGKPGKQSLKGTIHILQDGYAGLGGIKLKVKASDPF